MGTRYGARLPGAKLLPPPASVGGTSRPVCGRQARELGRPAPRLVQPLIRLGKEAEGLSSLQRTLSTQRSRPRRFPAPISPAARGRWPQQSPTGSPIWLQCIHAARPPPLSSCLIRALLPPLWPQNRASAPCPQTMTKHCHLLTPLGRQLAMCGRAAGGKGQPMRETSWQARCGRRSTSSLPATPPQTAARQDGPVTPSCTHPAQGSDVN